MAIWQPHARRRSILRLRPATSSSPLRWKRWASSVPQRANSFAVWATEFPPAQARLERHIFSSRESWCCCSASTLSYSTTACRRQTARTEYRTYLLVFQFFSQTPGNIPTEGIKNNINNNNSEALMSFFLVHSLSLV